MKTLVIIVTYNGMIWLERCLSSVVGYDVMILDNGSTDGTQAYIKEHHPAVMLRQMPGNLGFGRANNIGMRYALDAGYDYVYLMNQDAWVMPDTINTLISVHRKHPEYGVLSPMQLQADMRHFDDMFGRFSCSWPEGRGLVEDLYFSPLEEVYPVTFVMAAHWLVSKECLRVVGGFSPSFPHRGEDNNYLHRVLFHQFKVGVVPSARAVHDRPTAAARQGSMYVFNFIIPIIELSKLPSGGNPWPHILKNAVTGAFIFKSLRPLGYLAKLIVLLGEIKKNRDTSERCGAFLSEKCANIQE